MGVKLVSQNSRDNYYPTPREISTRALNATNAIIIALILLKLSSHHCNLTESCQPH